MAAASKSMGAGFTNGIRSWYCSGIHCFRASGTWRNKFDLRRWFLYRFICYIIYWSRCLTTITLCINIFLSLASLKTGWSYKSCDKKLLYKAEVYTKMQKWILFPYIFPFFSLPPEAYSRLVVVLVQKSSQSIIRGISLRKVSLFLLSQSCFFTTITKN